ncbi:hypothetical protein BDW22DRAFT_1356382 [Trametopsis cervina]|nr:hypothetical protein BDW22DRAFT_1356382 [Trametopsis cervina]
MNLLATSALIIFPVEARVLQTRCQLDIWQRFSNNACNRDTQPLLTIQYQKNDSHDCWVTGPVNGIQPRVFSCLDCDLFATYCNLMKEGEGK